MDGYERGTWARYRVLLDGGLVRVWVDGRPLMEVTCEHPLTSGRIGFRDFRRGTSVSIRNKQDSQPVL